MASESEELDFSIKDGITGPAADQLAALDALEASAKSAKDALVDFGDAADGITGHAKDAAVAQADMGDATDKLGDEIEDANEKTTTFAEGLDSFVGGVGGAAKAIGGFGEALWSKGILPAVEAHDHIAKLHAQFVAISGSKLLGEGALQTLDALRDKTGASRDELAPLAEQLLALKIPAREFKDALEGLADEKALGLGGEQSVLGMIAKVSEHQKISGREFKSLAMTAGISSDEIAAKMGTTTAKLQAQLKTGTVDADKFRHALFDLSKEKGAEAAEAQSKSFDATINRLKDDFADSFAKMDTKPLIDSLKHLGELAVQMGPQLMSTFEGAINMGAKFLGVIDAVDQGLHGLRGGFTGVTAGAEDVLGAEAKGMTLAQQRAAIVARAKEEAGNPFSDWDFKKAEQAVDNLDEAMKDQVAHGNTELANANKHMANAKTPEQLGAALKEQLKGLQDIGGIIPYQDVANDGQKAGTAAADGLAGGMAAGESKVRAAGAALGTAAKDGMAGALDAHSPSREAEKLGVWTGQGYTQGVERATGDAQAAVVEMVAPSNIPMPSFPAAPGAAASGGAPSVYVDLRGAQFGGDTTEESVRRMVHVVFDEARRAA